MHDTNPRGAFPLASESDARSWNTPEKGHGIFWTVNSFRGARRIENLERICAWAIDIDGGDKKAQMARIESSPLIPSLVVETKSGHHVYWRARDASPDHWNAIVLDRLVPHFGADKNARDIARILRAPGFLHLKDPANPFPVRAIWRHDCAYSERDMARKFEPATHELRQRATHDEARKQSRGADGDDFWERLYNLDCAAALAHLSGSAIVSGEQFTFRRNRTGTRNILVDGKQTSCWIDKNGRIGSLSHGGPTLYQWLAWYGHSPRAIVDALKQAFPDLEGAK